MTDTPALMTIGQFSSRARLSVRMLRHYDAHGVIVPAQVDPASGYRHYTSDQLADAADVRRLRDVGFGVPAIAALLAARGTPSFDHALRLQREALADDLRAAQQRLALLDQMIDSPGATMPITVSRTTLPAMTVVALRGTVPSYSDEGQLWARLMPEAARQGITPTGPCGVIENDPTYVEANPDLTVWMPVAPGTYVEAPLVVLELPEQDAVMAHVTGPYSQISAAHDQISRFIAEHGLTEAEMTDDAAGHVVNRYLTDPTTVSDETELVTEVYRPLA